MEIKYTFVYCEHPLDAYDYSISSFYKIVICVCVGRYIRSNLNMPSSLPARSGSHRDYDKDCPITVFGSTQARLVGRYIYIQFTLMLFKLISKRGHVTYLPMQSYHTLIKDLAFYGLLDADEIMFPK